MYNAMFAHAFRFEPFKTGAFQARMRSTFAPRKPRHRVLRVVLGVIGVALLAVLVMFGLFVGAAMIAAGLLVKLWKQRGKPVARDARVLDGEFRVVDPASLPR
jgi:hypothetical protein